MNERLYRYLGLDMVLTHIPQVSEEMDGIFLLMTRLVSEIRVQDIDHCAIVAGESPTNLTMINL
ncbi:hypothetical protein NIES4106_60380 (plasmid) [Fischerella sp. NIES-4106]|nr:hypothetical protein NIES4106_60380 [Fischerella sp. NIES-4106]